ncbi:3-oxoacyl-ACP synthase [Streptomyces sp. NPDC005438]|uniref:3-oxoacyl-ACP synthase n=1 Tax=Streptomyces sp. NPDC005438 TaxID=3156880 RepID=UPI0033B3D113
MTELPGLDRLDEDERRSCLALGIDSVRADDGMDPTALAEGAAGRLLAQAGRDPGELGALVVVEQRVPGTLLSSEATRLQHLLKADQALTFGVGGLGCVSVTPALLTARGLLAADPELEEVLVVHGSKPVSHQARYRHPVTVNGDGGQALLVGRDGPVRLIDSVQETNGAYWDLFHVDYRDVRSELWREECVDPPRYSFRLAIETRNRLAALLRRLLERNGLARGDVRGFVSQNLSVGSQTFTEESLDVSLLPVCRENLRESGHLGPNDVFLNLYTALERGVVGPGDRVVLINVSPVAAWSLLLVEIGTQEPTTP